MVGGPRGQNSRPRETGRGADEKGQRMERPSWAPEGIDIERPSQARVYDYFLGGSHNFAVDRAAAQQGIAVMPDIAVQAQANRAGSAPAGGDPQPSAATSAPRFRPAHRAADAGHPARRPGRRRTGEHVARLGDELPSGSYLAISHATDESRPDVWKHLVELSKQTPTPITPRSRAQIERFFTGFELVPPGLVWAPLWRPEAPGEVGERPERSSNYVGVGRKS